MAPSNSVKVCAVRPAACANLELAAHAEVVVFGGFDAMTLAKQARDLF